MFQFQSKFQVKETCHSTGHAYSNAISGHFCSNIIPAMMLLVALGVEPNWVYGPSTFDTFWTQTPSELFKEKLLNEKKKMSDLLTDCTAESGQAGAEEMQDAIALSPKAWMSRQRLTLTVKETFKPNLSDMQDGNWRTMDIFLLHYNKSQKHQSKMKLEKMKGHWGFCLYITSITTH